MAYKRPASKKQEKNHPIHDEFHHYGFIDVSNDPAWLTPHLNDLHDESRFALHQFSTTIDSVKAMNLSDFKPEVAAAKRSELILQAKRALMSFLKKQMDKCRSEINAVENMILRQSEPVSHNDPTKALLQELRSKEIRDNLRNIEPKRRKEAVAGSLERLQAVITNPDPSDIIISSDALIELRREYAFKQDPSLIEQEKDQREIYKTVRARAADVNATANKMLIYAKLDDPTPPSEHFETFPPKTEHEAAYAEKRIQAWQKIQDRIARDKAFDEKNAGVNLEIGERIERMHRI